MSYIVKNKEIKLGGKINMDELGPWLDIWHDIMDPYDLNQETMKEKLNREILFDKYTKTVILVIAHRLGLSANEVNKLIINREYYEQDTPYMISWPYF